VSEEVGLRMGSGGVGGDLEMSLRNRNMDWSGETEWPASSILRGGNA
jgi:hypothetical protein